MLKVTYRPCRPAARRGFSFFMLRRLYFDGSACEPLPRGRCGKDDSSRGQSRNGRRVAFFEESIYGALTAPAQLGEFSLCQILIVCSGWGILAPAEKLPLARRGRKYRARTRACQNGEKYGTAIFDVLVAHDRARATARRKVAGCSATSLASLPSAQFSTMCRKLLVSEPFSKCRPRPLRGCRFPATFRVKLPSPRARNDSRQRQCRHKCSPHRTAWAAALMRP